jgi:hypothetical protein
MKQNSVSASAAKEDLIGMMFAPEKVWLKSAPRRSQGELHYGLPVAR